MVAYHDRYKSNATATNIIFCFDLFVQTLEPISGGPMGWEEDSIYDCYSQVANDKKIVKIIYSTTIQINMSASDGFNCWNHLIHDKYSFIGNQE